MLARFWFTRYTVGEEPDVLHLIQEILEFLTVQQMRTMSADSDEEKTSSVNLQASQKTLRNSESILLSFNSR